MPMTSLNALLWREREMLDLLEFKLEEQQLLLVGGKSQWLDRATKEIDIVLEKVNAASLARAVESATVATELGLDDDAPLSQIVAATSEEAWRETLESHLGALRSAAARIAQLRDTNSAYLRSAHRATQETLAALDTDAYGGPGNSSSSDADPRILDTEI
ncbi:flagellar protein FlgN [Nesterenkonia massiliensis]|uniref:Flagellar protein FlgN n=1 Tax=Nesterenkonia massiliensis TaxID=1232429 RepID=A0ABT2HNI3_9MICC|nr:flagellar protein FlgN [Nesterenkonia massiliensis]MCT1606247.1 flagellar protein FlgN [Nesterenkonia massiliensis]